MSRHIRLFLVDIEREPEHTQAAQLVRGVGLTLAAPVVALGLCPKHPHEEHAPHEDHRPLPAVTRLTIAASTSFTGSTPFVANHDGANDVVMLRHRARRDAYTRIAMQAVSTSATPSTLK